jgi:surfeit locus 1 family protein
MHWKHDLIARVDARVHAEPVALPPPGLLDPASARSLEYLRVRLSGVYAGSQTALIRAVTERGTGYWAMTPMHIKDGRTIWINRGFVPAGTSLPAARDGVPAGPVDVIGLLRPSEPGGSLLQSNRPQDDRWYSRDLAALSQTKGTGRTAPVFIDVQQEHAGRRTGGGIVPVRGLTVIHFPDNHLSYALTWFAMALLSLAGIVVAWRRAGSAAP